jgi:uncharacterized protein involved in tellurium resistance
VRYVHESAGSAAAPSPAAPSAPGAGVRYVHEPKPTPRPSPLPTLAASASLDLDAPAASSPPSAVPAPAAPTSAASASLDLDAPTSTPSPPKPTAPSAWLDLDAPTSTPSPPKPPAPSASLDLDAPAGAPAVVAPAASGSLDLDAPAAGPAQSRAVPPAPVRRVRADPRIAAGGRVILTPTAPTVTLTRVQSGIGTLTIEAVCGSEVGDLRLGAAYQLAGGVATTVQMTQGERFAPPHSRRPVIVSGRERFEQLRIDLRQARELRRLVVYAFSETRSPLTWGGTLIVTTFGGGRLEVPMESLQGGTVAVLLSLYNVRGEFVLRAEMQALNGDVREAARAYGYDEIAWMDDRTPIE